MLEIDPEGTTARAEASAEKEKWFESMSSDVEARLPLYVSDWTIETTEEAKKIAASTFFAYFTSVLPAVIFGDQLQLATESVYGISEVLVVSARMTL